jgi:lysyl-tRNA synthetase class 2
MKILLQRREKIIDLIRFYFKKKGFLEVETPLLVSTPDTCPFNEVFETSPVYGKRAFLTPSPEFFMKKLLCQGPGNIFQISKAFRWTKETSPLHNPEFTILEWYRVKADYQDIMTDCENLISFLAKNLRFSKVDLSLPWLRVSLKDAFKKYAQIDLEAFLDIKQARKICTHRGYQVAKNTTWEALYHQVFLNEVEPKLTKNPEPFFLYDYPYPLASLAKLKKDNPLFAERFELYLGGLEIANAYSELTDWQEQEKRLKADIQERRKRKMKAFDYDREFISLLKKGMPETAGIALGVDRLIMFFNQASTIDEVLPFSAKKIFSS